MKKERSEYEKLKLKIEEFEKTNCTRIVAFKSGEGWRKVGWNSALFLAYVAGPMMGKEFNLGKDKDFYCKSKVGIISIPDENELIKQLEGVGIKIEKRTEDAIVFGLGRTVSKEEIETLKNAEEEKLKKIGQVLNPKDTAPFIWRDLRILMKKVWPKFENSSWALRETFNGDIFRATRAMMEEYKDFCDGLVEWGEFRDGLRENIRKIKKAMMIAVEIKAWSMGDMMRTAEMLQTLEETINCEDGKRNKK